MIYQIYYDEKIVNASKNKNDHVQTFGVYKARMLPRLKNCLYDDQRKPNLTDHNTLCEWRVLYYIWKHYPSQWVGFTSWQHNQKGFFPKIENIDSSGIKSVLNDNPIEGFCVRSLPSLMIKKSGINHETTLRQQFVQWSLVEHVIGKQINDTRGMLKGRYHTAPYWDFIINAYRDIYGIDLQKEIDWIALGKVENLHTWCNAFVARWDYFDAYMRMFSPIVLGLLDYFGSHPTDLELSYICERLIIIYNYMRYSNNDFC